MKLVHAKAIKLYLTEQVLNEFSRNRDAKLAESFSRFRLPIVPGVPSFMVNLEECKAYREALKTFEKSHSSLLEVAKAAASKRELKADEIFASLVNEAKVIKLSDELYSAATRRHKLGNPPGKSDSIGDQLNWEMLLASVPEEATLHIVTKDGDYASKLDPSLPSSYLTEEWEKTHGSDIAIYEQIGQFFQSKFPGEDFSLDIEKRAAINCLLNSGTFTTTHSALALLEPYLQFLTQEEAEEVVQEALSNSQIRWIINDTDVEKFFKRLLQDNRDVLSPRLRERLEEALGLTDKEPKDEEAEPEDEDDN